MSCRAGAPPRCPSISTEQGIESKQAYLVESRYRAAAVHGPYRYGPCALWSHRAAQPQEAHGQEWQSLQCIIGYPDASGGACQEAASFLCGLGSQARPSVCGMMDCLEYFRVHCFELSRVYFYPKQPSSTRTHSITYSYQRNSCCCVLESDTYSHKQCRPWQM
jgi:hypothetical protein